MLPACVDALEDAGLGLLVRNALTRGKLRLRAGSEGTRGKPRAGARIRPEDDSPVCVERSTRIDPRGRHEPTSMIEPQRLGFDEVDAVLHLVGTAYPFIARR